MLSVRDAVRRWWWSLALLLPVIVLYACEYTRPGFTGFIQYDQPYYMANARKFFDGGFHFLYGNPYSPDPQTPRIYFQVQLFVLGLIQTVTGCDPGVLYAIFGFFAALVCVRVALALYEEMAGLGSVAQGAGLVLFIWGGGVLALVGLVYHACIGSDWHTTVTDLFHFDPTEGWWFLNLGRNLIFPTEAYYHALALGAVLMAMRNQFGAALWLALALSLSHPFTGLQFLLILLAWCGWELLVRRNRAIPPAFPALLLVILIFHLGYYVYLLNQFAEHRVVFLQWSLAWGEGFAFVPADLLVAILAWRAMRNRKLATELFARPANRLLLAWFIVSFLLVHHDLWVQPRQPLHFSRGYVWIPLFLLGVQPLLELLETSFGLKNWGLRGAAVGSIFLIGLSDNLAWFGLHGVMALAPRWDISWLSPDGYCLSAEDRDFYRWLMNQPEPHNAILVAPDSQTELVYLAVSYTDYPSWYSHYALTPYAVARQSELAEFFRDGVIPAGWQGKTVYVIVSKSDSNKYGKLVTTPILYENSVLRVWKLRE